MDPTPFVIPPLGKPFLEQWRQQYGYVKSSGERGGLHLNHAIDHYKPSLKDRLLSLLVDEGIPLPDGDVEMMEPEADTEAEAAESEYEGVVRHDYVHLDERIKQELVSMGLEEFASVTADHQEDDQICAEMRLLQQQLQQQVAINYYRKRKLADLAKTKLPAQEFYSLLSDLDKQLEQVYQKRSKSSKKSKKKGGAPTAPQSSGGETPLGVAPPEAVRLLENRAKLVAAFSPYIPKLSEYLASEKSRLVDAKEEAQILQMAQQTGSWLPLPERPSQSEFSRPLPTAQPAFPL